MKYFLFFLTAFTLIAANCASFAQRDSDRSRETEQTQNDGIFKGTGQGYRGLIQVNVRFERGNIAEILVTDSNEDRFVGMTAIEELIDAVIEYNSTDVDAVSGATLTSKGFLEAVEDAIMKVSLFNNNE